MVVKQKALELLIQVQAEHLLVQLLKHMEKVKDGLVTIGHQQQYLENIQ